MGHYGSLWIGTDTCRGEASTINGTEKDPKIPEKLYDKKDDPDPSEKWLDIKEETVEYSEQADIACEYQYSETLLLPQKQEFRDESISNGPSNALVCEESNQDAEKNIEDNASIDTTRSVSLPTEEELEGDKHPEPHEQQQQVQRPLSPIPGPSRHRDINNDDDDGDSIPKVDTVHSERHGQQQWAHRPIPGPIRHDYENDGNHDEDGDSIPKVVSETKCFRGYYTQRRFSIPSPYLQNPLAYLRQFKPYFMKSIQTLFLTSERPQTSMKIFMQLPLTLIRFSPVGEDTFQEFWIASRARVVTITDISSLIETWIELVQSKLELLATETESSGFILFKVKGCNISHCALLSQQMLGKHIPFPQGVRGRSLICNPSGNEVSCVIQAIAAFRLYSLKPCWLKMHKRVESKKLCLRYVKTKNLSTITWEDLGKIEKWNEVSLYVYSLEKDETLEKGEGKYVLSLARKGSSKYTTIIPLLLLGFEHIALIKDLEKFYKCFARGPEKPPGHYFCIICLNTMSGNQKEKELHECSCTRTQVLNFPTEDEQVKFKNFGRTVPPSHLAFFHFETIINDDGDNEPCSSMSVAQHKTVAYSYVIIHKHGSVIHKRKYIGSDAVKHFLKSLTQDWEEIKSSKHKHPIDMTKRDEENFLRQKSCELCGERFSDTVKAKRRHDHSLPENNYIGAYCPRCNLQCHHMNARLITLTHNMSFYCALILKEMDVTCYKVDISSMSSTHFLRVKINDLVFRDSLGILNDSLDKLVESHLAGGYDTTYVRNMVDYLPEKAKDFVCQRKQVMCSEYMTDIKKLEETSLPDRKAFRDTMKGREISEEEYRHAQRVWEMSSCQSLGDYLKLYCDLYVGFLADVYFSYRKNLEALYGLDIAHYVSLSSYSYDSFFKLTGVGLDCPYDPMFYDLVKRNMRGGFVTCVKPHIEATIDRFLANGLKRHILQLDYNSLYDSVMCSFLPMGDVKKLSEEEMKSFLDVGVMNHTCDGERGYWVHLNTKDVSASVARVTDEFPLCLAHVNITEEFLSPYSKSLLQENNHKLPSRNMKLVASHKGMDDHLISLPLLQILIELGLEIDHVHAVYSYKQGQFLKPFIERNMKASENETCKIRKRIFKSMSNAVYEEAVDSEVKFGMKHKLICTTEKFLRWVSKPSFRDVYPLNEKRVLCLNDSISVDIKQPNYLGFHILELTRMHMYHFWYKVVKRFYGSNAQLAYADTDSFIFSIDTPNDLSVELREGPFSDHIDFSNFPSDHPCYNMDRKGQLGLLRSESGAQVIKELIALKPKMYSLLLAGEGEKPEMSHCEGLPVQEEKLLNHQRFKQSLFSDAPPIGGMRKLRSNTSRTPLEKRYLCKFDDKRYYVDGNNTVGYFHPDFEWPQMEKEGQEEVERSDTDEDDDDDDDDDDDSDNDDDDEHDGKDFYSWKRLSKKLFQTRRRNRTKCKGMKQNTTGKRMRNGNANVEPKEKKQKSIGES